MTTEKQEIRPNDGVTDEGFAFTRDGVWATLHDGRKALFHGHKYLVQVQIEQQHRLIDFPANREIVPGGEVRITFNDFPVYRIEFTDFWQVFLRVPLAVSSLMQLPVPLYSRELVDKEVIGRKVWWREQPAVIADFDGMRGRLKLVSEAIEQPFREAPWVEPYLYGSTHMWEDILSPNIYWYRDTP
jgi:hypothetical protein